MMASMKTLPRQQADDLRDKYWREMRDEWFKLEVLQDYAAEDESSSLEAWLNGNKKRSLELMAEDSDPEFTQNCQEKLRQGVNLTRIHVVEKPLTPYMKWEIEFYKRISMPLRGEKVYLLNRLDTSNLKIPAGDLMIFDKKRAILNTYNEHGLMTHETFYDENDDINQFLELRKRLIARAKPL